MALLPPSSSPTSTPSSVSLPSWTRVSFRLRTTGGMARAQVTYEIDDLTVPVRFSTGPGSTTPPRDKAWKMPMDVTVGGVPVDKNLYLVYSPAGSSWTGSLKINILMQELNAAGEPVGAPKRRSARVGVV